MHWLPPIGDKSPPAVVGPDVGQPANPAPVVLFLLGIDGEDLHLIRRVMAGNLQGHCAGEIQNVLAIAG
jgi:hypothetical protein